MMYVSPLMRQTQIETLLRLGQADAEQLLGVEGVVWGETEQHEKKEEGEAKTSHP